MKWHHVFVFFFFPEDVIHLYEMRQDMQFDVRGIAFRVPSPTFLAFHGTVVCEAGTVWPYVYIWKSLVLFYTV